MAEGNEIDVRLNLTLTEIEEFPENGCTNMLRRAPRLMVRLMLEQHAISWPVDLR